MALSESFWIFLAGGAFGIVVASMKMCGESKCKTLDICCIKITRDTEAEVEAENNRMEHGLPPSMVEMPRQERQTMSVDRG
jgi:hypothetical protein